MKTIILWAFTGMLASGQAIHVRPGDDFAEALAKARELRAVNPHAAIEIVLADGIHRISSPVSLTERDSGTEGAPLRIRAAKGARPVISGGRPVAANRATSNATAICCGPPLASRPPVLACPSMIGGNAATT